ncbi:TPA: DUF4365 domain-containing protein [Pseudomonas aeruginosa]
MSLPKRTREHRVDEKAVSMIGDMLVDDWLVRSQEGRDYGIDLQMERYDGERPTGDFIFVQVKGTEAAFSSENEKLSGFPVKTVNYAMLFSVPFFVFYASVSSRRVKFVWLQKYVEFVLEKTRPGWRDQESVTLEFPRENDLDSGLEKLVDIAAKERSMRFGYRYLMLYERFHTFAGKLAEGELKATRVCARRLRRSSGWGDSRNTRPSTSSPWRLKCRDVNPVYSSRTISRFSNASSMAEQRAMKTWTRSAESICS